MTKHPTVPVTASLATLLALFAPALVARADIFQWEYINPANPGQGKQQSAMLAPDGAGVNAAPGTNLSYRNLTMSYLIGADLSGANATLTNLTNAELSETNLTGANFSGYSDDYGIYYTDLTGANFTNAEVRGALFSYSGLTAAQLYSTASYHAHDLSGIGFGFNNLAGVNLANQNLTNASFGPIPGGIFTNAEVRGAGFSEIAASQLYSTASYQAHDLTGIRLDNNNLPGVNLAGQNLTNAGFTWATLTDANLSQAKLTNARFENAMLENADLSQANLINGWFGDATLTGANFTGAQVRGANFHSVSGGTGITALQLYSTASYLAHDLTGIGLGNHNLAGANLAGQNLTNANLFGATLTNTHLSQANLTNALFLHATLTGANLSQANLTNASFSGYEYCDEYSCGNIVPGANLTNANLSGADARGANFYLATLDGANTSNLISTNGHIYSLDLSAGASLVVRDYDGNPAFPPTGPLPIVVDQHLVVDATGTLRLVFDADAWDSTISFAPGISVTRGGTLELTFAPNVNLASQLGRTIDLFDWTGVNPGRTFTVSSPYSWDLRNLYTTGEVTLTAAPIIPGDFNHDGTVDGADYVMWRKTGGSPDDYNIWRANFGAPTLTSGELLPASVPEPATLVTLIVGVLVLGTRCRTAVS